MKFCKQLISVMALFVLSLPLSYGQDLNKVQLASNKQVVKDEFIKDEYVMATLYQHSAEVTALQIQAYKLARIVIDERLKEAAQGKYKKPIAIITDIDSTIADDTNFVAGVLRQNKIDWDNGPWTELGYYESIKTISNTAIPGAVDFFNYVAQKGVKVFYITNRDYDQNNLTVAQLKRLGFPFAQLDHVQVIPKGEGSDKQPRRDNILKNYEVVMLLGDNIGDFTSDFKPTMGAVSRQKQALDKKYVENWGDKWIVFPNATYGDWASAVWKKKKELSKEQRQRFIDSVLKTYDFNESVKWH